MARLQCNSTIIQLRKVGDVDSMMHEPTQKCMLLAIKKSENNSLSLTIVVNKPKGKELPNVDKRQTFAIHIPKLLGIFSQNSFCSAVCWFFFHFH